MVNIQVPQQGFRQESFPAITQVTTNALAALLDTNVTNCDSLTIKFVVSDNDINLGLTVAPQTDETIGVYTVDATPYIITFPLYSAYTSMAFRVQSHVAGAHGTIEVQSITKRGQRVF